MEFDDLYSNEFFIIDSDNLNEVNQKLYGYTVYNGDILENDVLSEDLNLDGTGAYVYVKCEKDTISISQDFFGSYGLYIYQYDDYFAISNSFIKLVEFLTKKSYPISLNLDYANAFLIADLCSFAYNVTLINEILLLPRNVNINIDTSTKSMFFDEIDYLEHSVPLNSKEGLSILDEWFNKWVTLIRNIKSKTNCISMDLSGGFDSRIVALLMICANIDLNKININSINDNKHTHKEDYRIASEIADEFNFNLNNAILSNYNSINFKEFETPLNISFYTKLGFHKQMYFKTFKSLNKCYIFNGNGGECVRTYYDKTPHEFLEDIEIRSSSYDFSLVSSSKKIVEDAFLELSELFNISDKNSKDLPDILYNEVRSRNHFGKQQVESFLSNRINLSPLMDPLLYKLKLNTDEVDDKFLLMALIFVRFCPKLLNFDFEGNRSFNMTTLTHAIEINKIFPFSQKNLDIISEPSSENICAMGDNSYPRITFNELDEKLLNIFKSKAFKLDFLKYFSEKVYNEILMKAQSTNHFPLSDVYAAIAIVIIANLVNFNKFKSYHNINDLLYGFSDNDLNANNSFVSSDIEYMLYPYITCRIDIVNRGDSSNNIEILSNSDSNSKISFPAWFKKDYGEGVVIESSSGSISLKFRCNGDGDLNIFLRGMDIRDRNGNRFPIYIDIKKVSINGVDQLSSNKLVWHDQPVTFKKSVEDSDIVEVYVEWLPFNKFSEYNS